MSPLDLPLLNKTDTDRSLSVAKEAVQWETTIKQEPTQAGLTSSIDQVALQTIAPLFALFNLDATKANLTALTDKITASASKKPLACIRCFNYTSPFPSDFYALAEVKTMRPQYLIGTWFNRQEKPFKVNMELDWVHRMSGDKCVQGKDQMWIDLFSSTGDHIWDFISEVHIHRTVMMEFPRPRDGWIEAPTYDIWKILPSEPPLNFIESMTKVVDGRTLVRLNNQTGGWATFEAVRSSDITAAAARLLFSFSDPLYCARSDGKVVIKLKDVAGRATLTDMPKFPVGRILVDGNTKFPSCIP